LSATPYVTLTYRALVTETLTRLITNVAQVDAGSAGALSLSTAIVTNGQAIYLPVIMK
jgi:hypothetical protein